MDKAPPCSIYDCNLSGWIQKFKAVPPISFSMHLTHVRWTQFTYKEFIIHKLGQKIPSSRYFPSSTFHEQDTAF